MNNIKPLAEVEMDHILKTLAYLEGNKTKTAKALQISLKSLYNKLNAYFKVKEIPSGTDSSTQ